MKYTTSGDGRQRANMNITVRMTKEGFVELKHDIETVHGKNADVRDILSTSLLDYIAFTLADQAKEIREFEVRYGTETPRTKDGTS